MIYIDACVGGAFSEGKKTAEITSLEIYSFVFVRTYEKSLFRLHTAQHVRGFRLKLHQTTLLSPAPCFDFSASDIQMLMQ